MYVFRLTIVFLIILCSTYGWNEDIKHLEDELSYLYSNKYDIDPEKAFENSSTIKAKFSHILSLKESFNYPFEKLIEQEISIINSNDKLVRIYSYDEYTGGTMHNNTTFVQFKNSKNKVSNAMLDSHASIKEIHEIKIGGNKYYMCFGIAKTGTQSYLNEVLFFTVNDNGIEYCQNCIPNEYKFINSPSNSIIIEYDKAQQMLMFENQSGNSIDYIFGDAEYEKVILKLTDGKFN